MDEVLNVAVCNSVMEQKKRQGRVAVPACGGDQGVRGSPRQAVPWTLKEPRHSLPFGCIVEGEFYTNASE
jgi:hypothetical protein